LYIAFIVTPYVFICSLFNDDNKLKYIAADDWMIVDIEWENVEGSSIYNKSIISGTFPARLKYSIIKLLHKKGDKENMTNYRMISLLTSYSEIFEKIIYERLLQNVEINKDQFGSRPSVSTDKASHRLIEEILNALNNRMMVGGIFCDLQKAVVMVVPAAAPAAAAMLTLRLSFFFTCKSSSLIKNPLFLCFLFGL
jgi:hypothetical protein